MKKLSKRSIDYIEMFLDMDSFKYISLSKHDVKILYEYYKKAVNRLNGINANGQTSIFTDFDKLESEVNNE